MLFVKILVSCPKVHCIVCQDFGMPVNSYFKVFVVILVCLSRFWCDCQEVGVFVKILVCLSRLWYFKMVYSHFDRGNQSRLGMPNELVQTQLNLKFKTKYELNSTQLRSPGLPTQPDSTRYLITYFQLDSTQLKLRVGSGWRVHSGWTQMHYTVYLAFQK